MIFLTLHFFRFSSMIFRSVRAPCNMQFTRTFSRRALEPALHTACRVSLSTSSAFFDVASIRGDKTFAAPVHITDGCSNVRGRSGQRCPAQTLQVLMTRLLLVRRPSELLLAHAPVDRRPQEVVAHVQARGPLGDVEAADVCLGLGVLPTLRLEAARVVVFKHHEPGAPWENGLQLFGDGARVEISRRLRTPLLSILNILPHTRTRPSSTPAKTFTPFVLNFVFVSGFV